MPSPFPGMDPYLETPRRWQHFHNDLAAEIQSALNRDLDPRYGAWLTSSVAYEAVEVARMRIIQPDVSVWQSPSPQGGPPAAVATIAPAPVQSAIFMEVPVQLFRVEIRTTAQDQLVAVIEILSPSNKRSGHEDCSEYRRKRRDLFRSSAHLMEIDLLRGGERPPLAEPVPAAPYYVVLSRAEQRPRVDVWPIQLADLLPTLPVPLQDPDPDVPLDLGAAVASVYERGPYRRVIDYREPPPPPPLSEEDAAWVERRLHGQQADRTEQDEPDGKPPSRREE
jgi:hypothetical protein